MAQYDVYRLPDGRLDMQASSLSALPTQGRLANVADLLGAGPPPEAPGDAGSLR